MATRGRISLETEDGSILSIYSHWNNSPEQNGRILKTHYNTREKVLLLISEGDISCLWTDKDWNGHQWTDCKYRSLTYAQRGEQCPPRLDANKYDYLANGEEYAYIFNLTNQWICYNRHQYEENTMPTVEEIPSIPLAV